MFNRFPTIFRFNVFVFHKFLCKIRVCEFLVHVVYEKASNLLSRYLNDLTSVFDRFDLRHLFDLTAPSEHEGRSLIVEPIRPMETRLDFLRFRTKGFQT